jgi:VCBS repeat-containing protein
MKSNLSIRTVFGKANRLGRRTSGARRLTLEPLEDRTLLAAGSILGMVFEDLDGDGVQDSGEGGLSGWTVELLSHGGGTGAPAVVSDTFENPTPVDGGWFGRAMVEIGDKILISADGDGGAVHLFASDGYLEHTFKRPSGMPDTGSFGWSLAAMGNNVLIGDRGVGVYLYSLTGDLLQTFTSPTGGSQFGGSVTALGDSVVVGDPADSTDAYNSGYVYVFDSDGTLQHSIPNPNPAPWGYFGWSVAVRGNDIIIPACNVYWEDDIDGQAYLFTLNSATDQWEVEYQLKNPRDEGYGDWFGFSVATVGDYVVIGAPDEIIGAYQTGIAYVFDCTPGQPEADFILPVHSLESPDLPNWGGFGQSVAFASGNILIGAPGDGDSGVVYVFDTVTGQPLQTITSPNPTSAKNFGNFVTSSGDRLLVADWWDGTDAPSAGIAYAFDALSTIDTVSTDGNGHYTFTGVDPGVYQVRQVVQQGYLQTMPAGGGDHTIALDGQYVTGINFGNVVDANWAPVAENDNYTVDEGTTLSVDATGVLANDADHEGASLSALLVRDAAHGQLTLNADGSFTYDVHPGFLGTDTFTYKASDGLEDSNVATVSIDVTGVYDRTTFQSTDVPKNIRDKKTITSTITVPANQSNEIIDLNVQLDITHTWDADLDVFLIAPDGTRVELFTDVGGDGDNFTATILDDEADASIASRAPSFTGSFQPEGSLSDVDSLTAAGVWTLEIFDDSRHNSGTLDNWSIETVTYEPAPNLPPVAEAGGPYAGMEDAAVNFNASGSYDTDGSVVNYTWDFGDGSDPVSTSQATISHTYAWGGAFDATLTVEDDRGGTATDYATATITEVNDLPVADPGGPYSGAVATVIDFDGSDSSDFDNQDGTVANDQTLSYAWDFGDGSDPVFGVTASHAYASEETYTITLTVGDGVGSDLQSTTVDVTSEPVVSTMHVSDLDGTATVPDRFWQAIVTITVLDDAGLPVADATVNGTWSGNTSGSESVITNSAGQATVDSDKVLYKKDGVVFTVDSIVHGSLDYDSSANTDPDGDSNGTSIVVFQDGTTAPPQQLLAEGSSSLAASDEVLTQQLAEAAATQALALWSWELGTALRQEIQIGIADLPVGTLGWAYGDTITLDVNANGAGWHVDLNSPGSGQVDLLTVVSHELGHLLGFEHSEDVNDVMAANLGLGIRRLPGYSLIDVPSGLILDPLASTAFDDLDDREEEFSVMTNVELVVLPPVSMRLDRPQQTSRTPDARLLDEAAEEATQLIDDQLLEDLALGVL